MANRTVILRLYKSLLKVSHRLDCHPVSKLLIHRSSWEPSEPTIIAKYYTDMLNSVLMHQKMMSPFHPVLLSDKVREEFRKVEESVPLDSRIDVAFFTIKKLNYIWNTYKDTIKDAIEDMQSKPTKQSKNSQLPTFKLYESHDLKPGLILMAHPLVPGQLGRSLVLILEHSPSKGSYGLIINKPLGEPLKTGVLNLPADIMDQFQDAGVSFGGFVRRLQYLHTEALSGSIEIPFCKRPLYAGGQLSEAISSVKEEKHNLLNFSFYAGCCTWAPRQLINEVTSGYWIPVESQPDLVISLSNYYLTKDIQRQKAIRPFTIGSCYKSEKFTPTADDNESNDKSGLPDNIDDLDDETFQPPEFSSSPTSSSNLHATSNDKGTIVPSNGVGRKKKGVVGRLITDKPIDLVDSYYKTLTTEQKKQAKTLTNDRNKLITWDPNFNTLGLVDVYSYALNSLGGPVSNTSDLSSFPDCDSVESCDWQ